MNNAHLLLSLKKDNNLVQQLIPFLPTSNSLQSENMLGENKGISWEIEEATTPQHEDELRQDRPTTLLHVINNDNHWLVMFPLFNVP